PAARRLDLADGPARLHRRWLPGAELARHGPGAEFSWEPCPGAVGPLGRPPYLLHPPAADGTTLRRGVATPDAVGLVRLDRPGEAFAGHRASGADRLGPGYGGEVRRLREEVDAGRVEAGGRLPPVIDVGIMGFGNHRNLSRRTLHNVWAAAHVPPLG